MRQNVRGVAVRLNPSALSYPEGSVEREIPSFSRWIARAFCLGTLLALELIVSALCFTYWYEPRFNSSPTPQLPVLVHFHDGIFAGIIAAAMAITILGWKTLRVELERASVDGSLTDSRWHLWFLAHLLAIACLTEWTSIGFANGGFESAHAVGWFAGWLAIALFALFSWGASVLPLQLWIRWIVRSPGVFLIAPIVGFAARGLVRFVGALSSSTILGPALWAVAHLLRLFGQNVQVDAKQSILATPTFSVQVGTGCAGIEGITLIVLFLALYFWFYRRELRFPHVFLLLPIGIGATWLLNVSRIAVLLQLGTWKANVAAEAFHSLAGWVCFNILACLIVVASQRIKLFTKTALAPQTSVFSSSAAVYIVPLLAIVAVAMLTSGFSHGFDKLYPVRVVVAAGALWLYRARLREFSWNVSWGAIVLGTLTFVLWICLQPGSSQLSENAFAAGLKALSAPAAALWLAFRVAGAVITVPIAEELAFRGYLTRKLISSNFEELPEGKFTWLSFGISSILFGMVHGQWLAGTVAGMLFAIALYRRGQLSDAITAHATTNGLLSVFVLSTHQWSLWT
jgi:exosortase E/protease (VPEID-CTERM system)